MKWPEDFINKVLLDKHTRICYNIFRGDNDDKTYRF